jgi:hypothetical protein
MGDVEYDGIAMVRPQQTGIIGNLVSISQVQILVAPAGMRLCNIDSDMYQVQEG